MIGEFLRAAGRVVVPCGLTLGATGCGPVESGPPGESRLASPDVPAIVTTEEVYTVGGAAAADEWEAFADVSEAHFDRAGNLILVDRRQNQIVVIGPEGKFLRRLSRSGGGPGELRAVMSVAVLSGNRVVVSDVGHRALLLFDAGGQFVDQYPVTDHRRRQPGGEAAEPVVRASASTFPTLAGVLPDDRLLLGQGRSLYIQALGEDGRELHRAYDPLAGRTQEEGSSILLGEIEVPLPAGLLPGRLAFGPPLLAGVLTDGRVAVADSVGYRVKLFRRDGSLDAVLERPFVPVRVTEEMRQAERERQAGGEDIQVIATGSGISVSASEAVAAQLLGSLASQLHYADEVPVIDKMAVDPEDRIWVTRSDADGVSAGPADVLTAGGEYLGTLAAADFRIPDAFGPDGLMAYIERDEMGVPTVRVLRLLSLGRPAV